MKQLNAREIIVGPVRLSYLNVFAPRKNALKNDALEYSVTLLFPKGEATTNKGVNFTAEACTAEIKAVQGAVKNAFANKFGTEYKGLWTSPLKDGDKELGQSDGEPKHPGFWFMNAKCDPEKPPQLIDANLNPARSSDWESGDWGLVKVALYGYDFQGKKGVGCGLLTVQFAYKDEAFGTGGGANSDGFAPIEGATAPMPATAAATGGADEYDPFADE